MERPARLVLRGILHIPSASAHVRASHVMRALHTSVKRADQITPTPTLQQLRRARAASASASAATSSPASGSGSSVPLRSPWPWHTVSSTPDTVVLERTVYARPSDLPPSLLLFAAGVWGLFVFTYFALPDPRKRPLSPEELAEIEEMEKKAHEAGFMARLGNKLAGSIFASSQPLLMGGVTVILAGFILGASRIVTRLTMVQVRSAAAPGTSAAAAGGSRTFLRLTSVGHEMWRGLFKSRELDISRCKPYLLDSDRATTVRLRLVDAQGQSEKLSFDRFPYSLDFREFKEVQGVTRDVVLSQNRLEHVFGPLRKAS